MGQSSWNCSPASTFPVFVAVVSSGCCKSGVSVWGGEGASGASIPLSPGGVVCVAWSVPELGPQNIRTASVRSVVRSGGSTGVPDTWADASLREPHRLSVVSLDGLWEDPYFCFSILGQPTHICAAAASASKVIIDLGAGQICGWHVTEGGGQPRVVGLRPEGIRCILIFLRGLSYVHHLAGVPNIAQGGSTGSILDILAGGRLHNCWHSVGYLANRVPPLTGSGSAQMSSKKTATDSSVVRT